MLDSADILKTKAWEMASHIALRDFSKEVREELGYTGVFAKTNKQTNKQKSQVVRKSKLAPHSSILAWRIPWTEEAGVL